MASKKLKNAIAKVEKQDVKIRQMTLNASLKKNAFAGARRLAENHDKYEAGGQVKKTRLWKLDLETRQGALFIVADLCADPGFLEACRARAKAEEAGLAWFPAGRWMPNVASTATGPSETKATPSESAAKMASTASPVFPGIPQQMTVRFRGRIPPGHQLGSLGLHYERELKEWRGEAVRAAVEDEIERFRHLLLSIEVTAGCGTGKASAMPSQGGFASDAAAESELPEGFRVELEN
jgi:hypothetical protein